MLTLTPILVRIRPIVYEILTKTFVCNGRMDLRTDQRTDGQTNQTIQRNVSNNTLNLSAKFETNPTHYSWSTAKTNFSENRVFDLDLWPYDLDLIPNSSPYWCLPSHLFWFQSDQWYMRYWQKRSFVTNQRTNQPTNGPTNQRTNQRTNQQNYS